MAGQLRGVLLQLTCVRSAARGATTLALLGREARLEAREETPERCAMMVAIVAAAVDEVQASSTKVRLRSEGKACVWYVIVAVCVYLKAWLH
jgi:hypothetical protein